MGGNFISLPNKDTNMNHEYTLHDFFGDFPDENAAFDFVLAVKNPGVKVYKRKGGAGYSTAEGKYYNPLQGTVFGGTHLDLHVMFLAVYLLHYSDSWYIKDFKDRLGINYVTSFKLLKKLRPIINRKQAFKLNLIQIIQGKGFKKSEK